MAKSLDIRTYNLADIDNKIISSSRYEEHPLMDTINDDGISDEAKTALHTNPFLYNTKKPTYKITSIEEFYIDVKKETKAFGAVIRGQAYKVNKKVTFTKKAFKKWHQDFLSNQERILNPVDDKMQIKGMYIFNKIRLWQYLSLIFIFIFIALVLYKPGLMWTTFENKALFNKMLNGINEAFQNKTVRMIAQAVIYLIITGLFYATFYNSIIKEHRKYNLERYTLYKDAKKTVTKEFNKKFKFARKYYLKNIRKDKYAYAPLTIEKTAIEKVDLKEIETITEAYQNKTNILKKQKKYFYIIKFLTIHGALFSGIFIIGYVVYFIIKNIL